MATTGEEITTGQLYNALLDSQKAILEQREWFDLRLKEVEASVRAEISRLREDVVDMRVADAGLPCSRHEDDIKSLKRSVGLAKLLAGVPAAIGSLFAAGLAYLQFTGQKPPTP